MPPNHLRITPYPRPETSLRPRTTEPNPHISEPASAPSDPSNGHVQQTFSPEEQTFPAHCTCGQLFCNGSCQQPILATSNPICTHVAQNLLRLNALTPRMAISIGNLQTTDDNYSQSAFPSESPSHCRLSEAEEWADGMYNCTIP